jgi:hypothetical protein
VKRPLVFVAVALLLAAGAVTGVARVTTSASPSSITSSLASSSAAVPLSLNAMPAPLEATAHIEELKVALDNHLALGDGAALQLRVNADCRVVRLTAPHAAGAHHDDEVRCVDVRLNVSGASASAFSDSARALLQTQLQQPFFVAHDESGRVLAIALDRHLDPLSGGLWRQLAAARQVVDLRADGAGQHTWQHEERDTSGLHTARYTWRGDTLERRRSNYQLKQPGTDTLALDGTVTSTLRVQDGAVVGVVERGVVVTRAQLGLAAQATTTLTIERTAAGTAVLTAADVQARAARRAALVLQALDDTPVGAGADQRRDEQLVDGRSASDLVDELRGLPPSLDDDGLPDEAVGIARARVLARLQALLRLDPRAAQTLVDLIRHSDDPALISTLLAALQGAGDPDAQAALVELAHAEDVGADVRRSAVANLGQTANPSASTFDALRQDVDRGGENADVAALALGNAAASETARDPNSPEAADAFSTLAEALNRAQSVDETVTVWLALTNTGDPRLLGLVPAHLQHPEASVRAAAAGSLRLLMTPDGAAALLTLAQHADAAVAVAAATALQDRAAAPLVQAIEAAWRAAPVEGARAALVAWLARDRNDPAVRALLDVIGGEDESEAVQALADEILAGAG